MDSKNNATLRFIHSFFIKSPSYIFIICEPFSIWNYIICSHAYCDNK